MPPAFAFQTERGITIRTMTAVTRTRAPYRWCPTSHPTSNCRPSYMPAVIS